MYGNDDKPDLSKRGSATDPKPNADSSGIKPPTTSVTSHRIPPAGPARCAISARGLWTVDGDQLVKEGLGFGGVSFGDIGWTDYDLTFEARKSAGPDGLGAVFHSSEGKQYQLSVGGPDGKHYLNRRPNADNRIQVLQSIPGTIRVLEWYKVKVSLRGQNIRIELDDHVLFNCTNNFSQRGFVGLRCWNSAGRFRNVKVTAPDGTTLWEGSPDLPENGKVADSVPPKNDSANDAKPIADAPDAKSAPTPPESLTNSVGMTLKLIPKGEFLMGSPDTDAVANDDESPQHKVRISRPFYLAATEVTVGQFRRVVEEAVFQTEAEKKRAGGGGWDQTKATMIPHSNYNWRNPGFSQTDDHPVVVVSWNDAVTYCNKLSKLERLKPYYEQGGSTGSDGYRLPTEAEWEYACRAGTITRYESGADPESLARVGNVADGTATARYPGLKGAITAQDGFVHTAPVGKFRPNAFGLFDMHGNVWEWCGDGYGERFYSHSPDADPLGPPHFTDRVVRGGNWFADSRKWLRSAVRVKHLPDFRTAGLGFRVARDPIGK
jgi:formylglycine-generating enzyme